MAGLVDQIINDLVRQFGQKFSSALSQQTGGGTGGNSVGYVPPIVQAAQMQGGLAPSYVAGAAGGGGSTVGQQAVAASAGWISAKAAATTIGMLPSTTQAVQMQLANMQSRLFSFSPGTSYHDVEMAAQVMTERGTATSTIDASIAMQRAGLMGFGGSRMGQFRQSLESISNVMPGLGLSGATDVYNAMQQGRNVNMAKLIGVQLRDRSGAPKSMDDIVEQLWRSLNQRKNSGRPLTSDDIRFSLLPGNALDFTLSQYFGNDADLRQTVIQMLYAKVAGAKNFSRQEMRRVGITTDAITSQATRTAQALKVQQGTEGAVVSGFEHATDAIAMFTDAISHVTTLLQPFVLAGSFASQFRAEGGPVKSSKPYVVGERGPEVFVPTADGTIIPNHALNAKTGAFLATQLSTTSGQAMGVEHKAERGQQKASPANTTINYGGIKIDITVPANFTEEKMVRELKRQLSISEIEKRARTR